MENNILEQHEVVLMAALKQLRKIKAEKILLEYNLNVQRKSNLNNRYMKAVIANKMALLEKLSCEYDFILSQIIPDETKVNNPILEQYGCS
jgi:hypothetical protein